MSNAKKPIRISWAAVGRRLRAGAWRVYAFALLLVIGFLTWRAFRYLLASLVLPAAVPPQVTGLPRRLGEEVMHSQFSDFPALQAVSHPRSPIAHYHRIDGWVQPDPYNNCTTSGCHNPLPHAERKEVRAFLNMHATSIHCGVCHMQTEARPRPVAWYDLESGEQTDTPAILRAYGMLTTAEGTTPALTEDDRRALVPLLRQAAADADNDPTLRELARHFAFVHAGAAMTADLIESAAATLARRMRGEYGAKLALTDAEGDVLLAHPDTSPLVREYLTRGQTMPEAERTDLLTRLHPLRADQPLFCGDCHQAEQPAINLSSLGYPPARAAQLVRPIVTEMIAHIAEGRPMFLPGFTRPEEPPTRP